MERHSPPPPCADTYHYRMHHPGVNIGLSYHIPPPPLSNEHALIAEIGSLKSVNDSLKHEVRQLKLDNKALKDALTTWYGHAEDLRKLVTGFGSGLAGVLDLGGNWRGAEAATDGGGGCVPGSTSAACGSARRWS